MLFRSVDQYRFAWRMILSSFHKAGWMPETIPLAFRKKRTEPAPLQLLERRGKISSNGSESWIAFNIKLQARALQNFPVQDHSFDLPRIPDLLRRIPRDNHNVSSTSGLQAAPFFLRMHNPRGIGSSQSNRLQRGQSCCNKQFQLTVKRLSLKHAWIRSVRPRCD